MILLCLFLISLVKSGDDQPSGENLAYKKPIYASSSQSDEFPPENAVDADGNTRWASSVNDEQYLVVDLQKAYTIFKVKISWENADASQFQIQTSTDDEKWTTVYENYESKGGTQWIVFDKVSARYVKVFCIKRATEYGFSIFEFEVYQNQDGGEGGGEKNPGGNAAESKKKLLEYFYSIKGQKTVIGIHNREPNSEPNKQTQQAKTVTGQDPALWSGDFLFSSDDVSHRWDMIKEAKKQWDNGSIVHIMLHVTPPTQGESGSWDRGVVSKLSDDQWKSLITDGSDLNKAWKKRLDEYASYFQYLKENGVAIMFRPLHEMNEAMFWWGGRKGSNGTAALYRITRDYLEKVKGLDNIIWIWDLDDWAWTSEWNEYNPGNDYWDIFAIDYYNSDRYTREKYNTALSIAGNKLIAIGECDKLPTSSELKTQPEWVFVMSWAELTFQYNSNEEIQNLYWADNVIIRKELPSFK